MDENNNIKNPKTFFVMMPFSKEFAEIRKSIRESVLSTGNQCILIDELDKVGKITEQIEAEIKSADACICDFTNKNPNVAWEHGFATALGKKIISLSQHTDDLFFDIKDYRTIIYNPLQIEKTLQQPLKKMITSLNLLDNSPELLIGTTNHEKMKLVASAKNIADTPYGIFNLMKTAKEHIFIAGQNLYFIVQNNSNKKQFKSELESFFKRVPNGQVDIMMCNENCNHAIKTWKYAQNISNYKEQLEEVFNFLKEIKSEFDKIPEIKERFIIKKFDFIPVSASFIDPKNKNGIAVIIPSVFQRVNDARPCYILSNHYNNEIFQEYWSVYYYWYTGTKHNSIQ